MQTIQLEIRDDYVEKVISFLKLLPENVAKITTQNRENTTDELISRVEDIRDDKVKAITRDELFDDI